jgi:hypothetical protein
MDNVQKHNTCSDIPSSQTFKSYLNKLLVYVRPITVKICKEEIIGLITIVASDKTLEYCGCEFWKDSHIWIVLLSVRYLYLGRLPEFSNFRRNRSLSFRQSTISVKMQLLLTLHLHIIFSYPLPYNWCLKQLAHATAQFSRFPNVEYCNVAALCCESVP